ncbi:NAD(+)--dinitrogen-reductase ADP-D-ribosyltransferase [Endothiovibrio diazotrophicus]
MKQTLRTNATKPVPACGNGDNPTDKGAYNGARHPDKAQDTPATTLPRHARLPINRCNLPAAILGGLTFQRHPTSLAIDGVDEFHRDLLRELDRFGEKARREEIFTHYMEGQFSLESPEEAGWAEGMRRNADYRRVMRGWSFDADNREAAVLKAWVESRFGLRTRHHRVPLEGDEAAHHRFLVEAASGLYNTNALEHQLDLLYRYCQYELTREDAASERLTLYRGINHLDDHGLLEKGENGRRVILLNNVNSFTRNRDRASEFGDHILTAKVPTTKVVCYSGLLQGLLRGEEEYVVLGGAYEVTVGYF